VLPDPALYPDLDADAVTVNVPVEVEENEEVNWPLAFVVPDAGFRAPPLLLRLTEAPETALPPDVTVTVIVEDCEVVMLPGFAVTVTERVGVGGGGMKLAVTLPGPEIVNVVDWLDPLATETLPEVDQLLKDCPAGGFAVTE